ncbi:sensor histidine kinase [Cellulomonas hominis]
MRVVRVRAAGAWVVEEGRRDDVVDRRVGWIIALAGMLLLAADALPAAYAEVPGAGWWSVGAVAVVLAWLCLGVLGQWLPLRVLRLTWGVLPVGYVLLLVTWAVTRAVPLDGTGATPWLWELDPAVVSLGVLAWRWQVAVLFSQVSALSVPAGLWAVTGAVPREVVLLTLLHLGNGAIVAIFIAIRHRLTELTRLEQATALQARRLARARAGELEQARLATVVHDEVLSTLTLAVQSRGPLSPELVAQARRAQVSIAAHVGPAPGDAEVVAPVPVADLVDLLRARARGAGAELSVVGTDGAGDLPADVAHALVAACEEVLRNSIRHAAGGEPSRPVRREVLVRVEGAGVTVRVVDDGVGFDPLAVPPARVGLRLSVHGRMATVPGATVGLVSAPGRGTRVELGWRG